MDLLANRSAPAPANDASAASMANGSVLPVAGRRPPRAPDADPAAAPDWLARGVDDERDEFGEALRPAASAVPAVPTARDDPELRGAADDSPVAGTLPVAPELGVELPAVRVRSLPLWSRLLWLLAFGSRLFSPLLPLFPLFVDGLCVAGLAD